MKNDQDKDFQEDIKKEYVERRVNAVKSFLATGELPKNAGPQVVWDYMQTMAKERPDELFEAAKQALETGKFQSTILASGRAMAESVKVKSELAGGAVEAIERGFDSQKHDLYSIKDACDILEGIKMGAIAKADKEVAEKAQAAKLQGLKKFTTEKKFDDMEQALATGDDKEWIKQMDSNNLPELAQADPERLFAIAEQNILRGNHGRSSEEFTYEALTEVVKARPETASQVINAIKQGSTKASVQALAEVAKFNPDAVHEVESAMKEALQSDKLTPEAGKLAESKLKAFETGQRLENIQSGKIQPRSINSKAMKQIMKGGHVR
jgi:hypothetical protein